jgi:hypothetical protein
MSEDIYIPDETSSASLVARWVLMLSHLYYDRNVSLVDDATYDGLCAMVADRWEELDDALQTMLGSPDEIRTTGSHVYLSRLTIAGAEALARDLGVELEPYTPKFESEYEDKRGSFELTTIRG